jgi:transcription termination factor Rho
VRKYGLRRGDAVTGQVRQQRDGERKDKYNALVQLDSVNGLDPDEAKDRPDFTKLTPLYPQDRLRLETDPSILTTRVIDLVMPVGKGQRALIVSPPKAGKTMVMQAIANAITTNNPECHLMVVLVDERPEEVTDMQRSVKGEVIASTFDRPPQDHITVAELSIERAKRLVELGHDVVVLLDSITRLGRAYNLGAPPRAGSSPAASTRRRSTRRSASSARPATSRAAARSRSSPPPGRDRLGDGHRDLRGVQGHRQRRAQARPRLADKRIFPAIDVDASGTRKEEILLAPRSCASCCSCAGCCTRWTPPPASSCCWRR